MQIEIDGIPVSRHSEIVVTTPPWTPHFYVGPTDDAIAGARKDPSPQGEALRIEHRGQDAFEGVETLLLAKDGSTLEQTFEFRFMREGEALIEWCPAALDSALLAGRRWTIRRSGAKPEGDEAGGRFPVAPLPDGPTAIIADGVKSVAMDTRVGPILIEVDSTMPLVLQDHRASQWADPGDPYFWFGVRGTRIRKDRPVRCRILYTFPGPPKARSRAAPADVRADVHLVGTVQTTRWTTAPDLIPRPKEINWEMGEAILPQPDAMAFRGDAAAEAGRWYRDQCRQLANSTGGARRPSAASATLEFRTDSDAAGGRAEGYEIEATEKRILVRAGSADGFRHAARSLVQMTRVDSDGHLRVRTARIRDWPSLAFRGVHLFTSGRGPALHLRLIHDVLGALKMNNLVLEAEYIKWDSHPEIHHPRYGMPKAEVRQILDAARAEGIEVTPLINTLGHCQWMFETGQHLDLCEDPEAKWAYCVTNEDTYKFLFPILEETLDLFKPRYVHIGHDEFADRGRVPYRPESKKFTIEQLLMKDTLRLHAWLKERNVRVMMWGDMLLAKGEAPDATNAESTESAKALRGELPKDVVITDWHYATVPADRFTSLKILQSGGHETIAATWNRPANIANFAQAAVDAGSRGLLQTTWAGYSLDESSFRKELPQYCAYVLAADAAWNGDRPPRPDPFTYNWRFLALMGLSSLQPANHKGFTIDLTAACNYARGARDADGWFGQGPEHDLSGLPAGQNALCGVTFETAVATQPSVIALHGLLAADLNFPVETRIRVDTPPCRRLLILHATNFGGAAGAAVGRYRVEFADGPPAEIELRYGENILACTDLSPAPDAPVVWDAVTPGKTRVALRVLVWDLPNPGRAIRGLSLRSAGSGPSPLIFAVTGVQD